jgi:hypothetical protein
MPFASPYPDVAIPPVSGYEYLFGNLTTWDRQLPAPGAAGGVPLAYGDLVDRIDAVADGLASRGKRK